MGIFVSGEYAYVADNESGLQIIDITIPDAPEIVGSFDTQDRTYGIFVSDNYAYVSDADSGLHVIDISDRRNPSLVVSGDTPGRASRLFVRSEYIYVADGIYFTILRFDPQTDVLLNIDLPRRFSLLQNYPNPFNASTRIQYSLPEATHVIVDIYDILGRKLETLIDQAQPAGYHQVVWYADDKSSGLYFYRIQAGDFAETRKMVLLK